MITNWRCKGQWIIAFCGILIGLTAIPLSTNAQVKIRMQNEGGVYTLPCTVNGLQLRFILDTGASDVSISLSEAVFMLKNGYLDANDIKGSTSAQIANGTYVSNTSIVLKEIIIGGVILKDINASIIETADAPLLLGQSALQKLGPYQINGDEFMILNAINTNTGDNGNNNIDGIRQEAKEAYDKKLYNVAISGYSQLTNAGCANENDIYNMALSYYHTAQFDKAMESFKKLETASQNWSNSTKCNYFQWMGICYGRLNNIQEASFYLQKAEMVASTEEQLYSLNFSYAFMYFNSNYDYQILAGEYAKKAIDHYGKWKNIEVDYYKPTCENLYFAYTAVIVADIKSRVIKSEKGYKILNKYAKQGNVHSKNYLMKIGKYDTRSGFDKFKEFAGWD